jgi:hypothetical protein
MTIRATCDECQEYKEIVDTFDNFLVCKECYSIVGCECEEANLGAEEYE